MVIAVPETYHYNYNLTCVYSHNILDLMHTSHTCSIEITPHSAIGTPLMVLLVQPSWCYWFSPHGAIGTPLMVLLVHPHGLIGTPLMVLLVHPSWC